jgi:hypothetical protein
VAIRGNELTAISPGLPSTGAAAARRPARADELTCRGGCWRLSSPSIEVLCPRSVLAPDACRDAERRPNAAAGGLGCNPVPVVIGTAVPPESAAELRARASRRADIVARVAATCDRRVPCHVCLCRRARHSLVRNWIRCAKDSDANETQNPLRFASKTYAMTRRRGQRRKPCP